jgi:hypothetical protein
VHTRPLPKPQVQNILIIVMAPKMVWCPKKHDTNTVLKKCMNSPVYLYLPQLDQKAPSVRGTVLLYDFVI